MPEHPTGIGLTANRTGFIGGSDARIIMGDDEAALLRLWRGKRGEVEPEGLSGDLVLPLWIAKDELNGRWYEAIAGGVPLGSYIVTLCYAIAVILLWRYPWNFLLLGLLFLIRNKPLREPAFVRYSSRMRMLIGLAAR